jgi:hypothetical protein
MANNRMMLEKQSPQVSARASVFERICQFAVLGLGARCAYAGRNLPVGADGLAYLDVARAYAGHHWHTAFNGYWGPLYAWLLAMVMQVFRPGTSSELTVARGLNFALFAAAMYAFSRYWRAVAEWSRQISAAGDHPIPVGAPLAWILLGYLLFATDFLWSVGTVNPDILVAAIVFAVGGLLFKFNTPSESGPYGLGPFALLGLMLAVGFYAKAILLYFAIFVLAGMALQGLRSRLLKGPITAILVFLLLVSPFVIGLSRTLGHLSAGDSGRLNYAWFVDGPETKTWENGSTGAAPVPFYPGLIVFNAPRVFRVPSIEGVTYAPWYDASRFDTRSRPVFNLRAQLRQLAINLHFSRDQLFGAGAALTVPLLIFAGWEPKRSLRRFAATWFCTLPAAAIFGMYMLVHLVERFVFGFSLLLWGAAWASVSVPSELRHLAGRAMLALSIVYAAYNLPGLFHFVISRPGESVSRDMVIAAALPRYGLAAGDLAASLGDGQEAYWAHFARLSVAAEVWSIDSGEFWAAPPEVQQAALRAMAESGAKAAIWRADSTRPCPSAWLSLPEGSGCIIALR